MRQWQWKMQYGKWKMISSPTVSHFHPAIRRRVMSCRPTFLHKAFQQAVLVFAALSACSATANAQAGAGANNPNSPSRGSGVSHTIRGKFLLPSGNLPDQRMRVVLELNTGGVVNEIFSDSVGNFEFRALPNGTYKIVVPPDGRPYEVSQEVVELYGNFARTFSAQIYLK